MTVQAGSSNAEEQLLRRTGKEGMVLREETLAVTRQYGIKSVIKYK